MATNTGKSMAQSVSLKEGYWKIKTKNMLRAITLSRVEVALHVVALASIILLLLVQKPFIEDKIINYINIVWTILLSALISLASAAIIYYFPIQPILKKIQQQFEGLGKPRIHDVIRTCFAIIAFGVLVWASPKTHLWLLCQIQWYGPQVDLTSSDPEKTNQQMINLPWVTYGQDFGEIPAWTREGISQKRAIIDEKFKQLSKDGVKSVLWFLLCDGRGAPAFDKSSGDVTNLAPTFWSDYDTAIELARKYRIGILWVLIDFMWALPEKTEKGASLHGRAGIMEGENKSESFFQNALIPLLRRYPLERNIVGWIIINEPENILKEGYLFSDKIESPENVTTAAKRLQGFTKRASELIKHYTYRQPVSIGVADLESLLEYWGNSPANLDFFVFHHYESYMPPPISKVRGLMPGAGNKPIYIGEFNKERSNPSLNEFITKTRSLGYAGAWPWIQENPLHLDPGATIDDNIRKWKGEITEHIANCTENRLFKQRTETMLQALKIEEPKAEARLNENKQNLERSKNDATNQRDQLEQAKKELTQKRSQGITGLQIDETMKSIKSAGGDLAIEESKLQSNQQVINCQVSRHRGLILS